MLLDEAEVIFKGGHGGRGVVSFGKKEGSGPDGGNGGRGGDLYVRAVSDITLLNQFSSQTTFAAEDGMPGGDNKRTGRDGDDLEVLLPVGTSLIDQKTGKLIVELTAIDQRELVCKGGLGGRGNYEFRSPQRTTPKFAQAGLSGQEHNIKLVLKLIADFGLIGIPNAGKSSLLKELTNARPKIANYAFTTLSPNLGVMDGKIIADIPGLIEGASSGKGLGISFLKHIEKVAVLVHCIASDSVDPIVDYHTVRNEIKKYNPELTRKPEVVVITKSDLVEEKRIKNIKKDFNFIPRIVVVSIHDWESLAKLKKLLLSLLRLAV